MGPKPSPLDNWISNSHTYINKRKNGKRPAQIHFHPKTIYGLWVEMNLGRSFSVFPFVYIGMTIGDPVIKRGGFGSHSAI
jgi:hypothetical protein